MKTKEELKKQASDLIDEAYENGLAVKAAECEQLLEQKSEEYEAKIAELQHQIDNYQPIHEFSLENRAVAAYMANHTYDAPGFATGTGLSVIDDYIQEAEEGSHQSWTEKPAEIPIKFDSIDGLEPVNGIYNFVPGCEYTYHRNEGGKVITGKFRTKPNTVRMIEMAYDCPVVNIRDLGGYKCEGGHVAYCKVLRSATLARLTKDCDNTKILVALGVTDEITFSSSNPARTEFGLWTGVHYAIDAYASIITKSTQRPKIKSVFTRILNDIKNGGCALMHCYAGTDRSGSVSALLLGLLGVSEADVIRDWESTCFCCWFNRVRISDWEKRADVKKDCPEGQLRQMFQKMKSLYGKDDNGNIRTFQQQCEYFLINKVKLTAKQISSFKELMIVKD